MDAGLSPLADVTEELPFRGLGLVRDDAADPGLRYALLRRRRQNGRPQFDDLAGTHSFTSREQGRADVARVDSVTPIASPVGIGDSADRPAS